MPIFIFPPHGTLLAAEGGRESIQETVPQRVTIAPNPTAGGLVSAANAIAVRERRRVPALEGRRSSEIDRFEFELGVQYTPPSSESRVGQGSDGRGLRRGRTQEEMG